MQRLLASGSPSAPTYVDDVFSAYTYSGNGGTQSIVNGIDLLNKGGLIWTKDRNTARGAVTVDTARGVSKAVGTSSTAGESTFGTADVTSFNSNGYVLNNSSGSLLWNNTSETYVSWTFRKAAKFFDVVTFTTSATTNTNQRISHSLGQAPGMIVVKSTAVGGSWVVYHQSLTTPLDKYLVLESTAAVATSSGAWGTSAPTSTDFGISTGFAGTNTAYVAYLFAHDTATDGLIQCGSFTTDGSGNAMVTLGWEPQFVMVKTTTGAGDNWTILDSARGLNYTTFTRLYANLSNAESVLSGDYFEPNTTGFKAVASLQGSQTYIYMAIRRPNKPPTTGTQVYNAIARTGTGAAATVTGVGFAPDLYLSKGRAVVDNPRIGDRLRGASQLLSTPQTAAETTSTSTQDLTAFLMDGVSLGTPSQSQFNTSAQTEIDYFFKRAPQVFDEVCYTGTGVARTVAHNLGVAPELIVIKHRVSATEWPVYHSAVGNTAALVLNTTAIPATASTYWNNTSPTSSVFTVGAATATNGSTGGLVAYLFATKAGISKVFSYTGNGSSQTINCGFSAGARFILIKRTDSTGDWYVWDTVRGVVAGNDPHLSLNTTAAEVTTNDSIDPDNSGFIVNQLAATNINVTSATYIGLAFA